MAIILDGTNGLTFPDSTTQATKGLPLTGGTLTGGLTATSLTANTSIAFGDGTSQTTSGTSSLAASGWQKLPNGLIIQWGTMGSVGDASLTFPIAFPNNVWSISFSTDGNGWIIRNGFSKTGSGVVQRTNVTGYANQSGTILWIAIGN